MLPGCDLYWYFGWLISFERWHKIAEKEIFKRIAWVCRYGNTSYWDALDIPVRDLRLFSDALAKIVETENKSLEKT